MTMRHIYTQDLTTKTTQHKVPFTQTLQMNQIERQCKSRLKCTFALHLKARAKTIHLLERSNEPWIHIIPRQTQI